MYLISVSKNTDGANYLKALPNSSARYAPTYEDSYDGLVLAGGGDIHPKYYGEAPTLSRDIDEVRDRAEFQLMKDFIRAGKPIFGICRGIQVINVYFGGTLFQHMKNASEHMAGETDSWHQVCAEGALCELYGKSFEVNSAHHQAIDRVGHRLSVQARCGQAVEAVKHTELPIFGVQFHPERMENGHKLFTYIFKY